MLANSDEKTLQACCDEKHAWCEDGVSTWPAKDSHLPTLFCKSNKVDKVFNVFRYESEIIRVPQKLSL